MSTSVSSFPSDSTAKPGSWEEARHLRRQADDLRRVSKDQAQTIRRKAVATEVTYSHSRENGGSRSGQREEVSRKERSQHQHRRDDRHGRQQQAQLPTRPSGESGAWRFWRSAHEKDGVDARSAKQHLSRTHISSPLDGVPTVTISRPLGPPPTRPARPDEAVDMAEGRATAARAAAAASVKTPAVKREESPARHPNPLGLHPVAGLGQRDAVGSGAAVDAAVQTKQARRRVQILGAEALVAAGYQSLPRPETVEDSDEDCEDCEEEEPESSGTGASREDSRGAWRPERASCPTVMLTPSSPIRARQADKLLNVSRAWKIEYDREHRKAARLEALKPMAFVAKMLASSEQHVEPWELERMPAIAKKVLDERDAAIEFAERFATQVEERETRLREVKSQARAREADLLEEIRRLRARNQKLAEALDDARAS